MEGLQKHGIHQHYSNPHDLKDNAANLEIVQMSNQGDMETYRSGTYTEACSVYPCTA